ncbi:MAG TPA: hypothetical protein VIH27_00320 [Nitrososphaerales archaeon]
MVEEKLADEVVAKMNEIKKAANDFKKNVESMVSHMNVEMKDWHFGVENHEKGVTLDVAIKLIITRK